MTSQMNSSQDENVSPSYLKSSLKLKHALMQTDKQK